MTPRLIVRDLPGIADLEVNLLINRKAYDGAEEDFAEKAARQLFGIGWDELNDIYERQDLGFLVTSNEWTDDEIMQLLQQAGIDFSDERGHPLRCTLLLAGFAEVAFRGFAGHLPDQNLDKFASGLEQERDAFLARKRR